MDYKSYLSTFQDAADKLDKNLLRSKSLEVAVGITLESVFLKLYKREWTNDAADPMNAKTRIFFSIWLNEKTLKSGRIYYNIHALKLRHLKGYSIASREFAETFRTAFKTYQDHWNNVSVQFGPLTLMEGWEELNKDDMETIVTKLASNFLQMDHLIDKTLETYKE